MIAETEQLRSQNGAAYAKLLGKVWSDAAEKSKFLADPKAALTNGGFAVPVGVTVKVAENTDNLIYVVSDTALKKADKDLKAVLAAKGIAVPAGVAVKVLDNTDKLMHVVLPLPPSVELSEEDLEKVAGGATAHTLMAYYY